MLLPLSVLVILSVVEVRGESECPAPAEVVAAQRALSDGALSPWVAEVEESAEGLTLRLRTPEGELLAERALQTRADCAQRATAAAVVLSAWEAELLAAQQQAPVLPPPPAWTMRLGAELSLGGTDHGGLRLLPGGAVVGQLWLGERLFGLIGRVGTGWPSRSPLATAEAVWMRPLASVEAGGWWRFAQAGGDWLAELTCGVALVRVWGEGFSVDRASTGADVSVSPAVRWLGGAAAFRPTASAGAVFWLVPQRVSVGNVATGRVLPQWELRTSAGFLWGR